MKKYILIAGVNGAGKSTLYHSLQDLHDTPRINTDDIIREFGGRWDNLWDVTKAGKIAVKKIDEYFQKGISFNQETTLCGKTILRNIRRAKKEGFFVEVHYIGVDSVQLAKERVRRRVLDGGHGIPDKDIERRYWESFKNLLTIIEELDMITFYDNTEYFERIAVCRKGMLETMAENVPQWFKEIQTTRNGNK